MLVGAAVGTADVLISRVAAVAVTLDVIPTVHVPSGAIVSPTTVNFAPVPVAVVAVVLPVIVATPVQPELGAAVYTVELLPFVAATVTVCCVPSDGKFNVIVLSELFSSTTGVVIEPCCAQPAKTAATNMKIKPRLIAMGHNIVMQATPSSR